MTVVGDVSLTWLVQLVNGYGTEPRAIAGQSTVAYPGLGSELESVRAVSEQDRAGVADRLWPLFVDAQPVNRSAQLNVLLAATDLTPQLDSSGTIGWRSSQTDPVALLTAGCAAALLAAVNLHGWPRLGVCAGIDCVNVFIDQQRRTARRYCSPTCLNRARIRAHRARLDAISHP